LKDLESEKDVIIYVIML